MPAALITTSPCSIPRFLRNEEIDLAFTLVISISCLVIGTAFALEKKLVK
jgi:hypothetical protein